MKFDKKMVYFMVCCICLVLVVIGATYAYFTASISDDETVKGDAATVSFSLRVDKITSIDMAYGLVPMKSFQAPNAAIQMCRDDLGNAGCQMYKITVSADSDTVMFLDGYVVVTPKDERLETRFTRIYTEDNEESFHTGFTYEDMMDTEFNESDIIKNGVRVSKIEEPLNNTDDYGCLLVTDEQIGGEDVGRESLL